MKNWIALAPMIGIALVLIMNPAAADQHGQHGRQGHGHFRQNRHFGGQGPWSRPGYYHRPRRFRQPQRRGYRGNGYYPQPPIVYGPPQPPAGLSFFFGGGGR